MFGNSKLGAVFFCTVKTFFKFSKFGAGGRGQPNNFCFGLTAETRISRAFVVENIIVGQFRLSFILQILPLSHRTIFQIFQETI